MDDSRQFAEMIGNSVRLQKEDPALAPLAREWFMATSRHKYTYRFSWLGRPIIQRPQDILAMQELIWSVRPDLVVETGIARGGSMVFYASMLELLGGDGIVVGVDVDIREHNGKAIREHPMAGRIRMIQGSSVDPDVVARVRELAKGRKRIMVCLDSLHTEAHVLAELAAYADLVTEGSYLVVFDTVIEDMPEDSFPDRPWGVGDNPRTAVAKFLRTTDRFVVDEELENRLIVTVAPGGYLKCVKPAQGPAA
ncbi:cephalosporin hydroxylase family protein [Pseudodesulfovibrio sp.]|uniref:cephalosporin hydroxylase family protein n=1 Tax=Pseudodesulfovibrio sp. TaxID=2035812 RepID=UPI00262815A1|nr:cephalosporin hydroxylase family protein [Pseudodesulfovibrio sp.]MDD3312400.1 cephalosporin hydroxylase family protein [Pseudodesulfovibrio sp.]